MDVYRNPQAFFLGEHISLGDQAAPFCIGPLANFDRRLQL